MADELKSAPPPISDAISRADFLGRAPKKSARPHGGPKKSRRLPSRGVNLPGRSRTRLPAPRLSRTRTPSDPQSQCANKSALEKFFLRNIRLHLQLQQTGKLLFLNRAGRGTIGLAKSTEGPVLFQP